MSDELNPAGPIDDLNAAAAGDEDEFEEITSDEVDRVVEQLEALIETVDSENIRFSLEEAANSIYSLIYEDENDAVAEAA
jgi:uncharacterized FlaG/YvyC family protein